MVFVIHNFGNRTKYFQETIKYLRYSLAIPWQKLPIWCVQCCAFGGIAMILITANFTVAQNSETSSMVLTETQISEKIQTLPGWNLDGQEITRTFQFSDFVAAIDFVNKLVEPAEAAGHHPDIAISYNKVTISLTTHDAGGLTNQDFALAETISQLAK
ncbi:MAG TPA: 4a-hydroxytetrahydrobiopterin dehydratase [Xenococcaceae cyanobacterium]